MKRKTAIFVIAWLSSIILTGVFVYAATPTTTFSIYGGNYPSGAASYTIFSDGSNYFSKDVRGVIAYSGTDAVTVFDSTAAICPAWTVIQMVGDIEIDTPLIVPEYISLYFDKITITATDQDGIIASGRQTIRGIYVNFPNGYTESAVKIENAADAHAQDVIIEINSVSVASGFGAAGSVAVHLLGDAGGCYHNTVHVVRIYGAETGVLLESANAGFCTVNKIVNSDVWMAGSVSAVTKYGYRFIYGGAGCFTSSNTIEGANCDDIHSGSYGYYNCENKNTQYLIGCCTSDLAAGATALYNPSGGYIQLTNGKYDGGATYTSLYNEGYLWASCVDLVDSAGIVHSGTYLKLENCLFSLLNLLQMSSGVATVSSGTSTKVVTHMLETTPTSISLTGRDAEVANLYLSNVNNSTFTINAADGSVSADRAVYWSAEYQP